RSAYLVQLLSGKDPSLWKPDVDTPQRKPGGNLAVTGLRSANAGDAAVSTSTTDTARAVAMRARTARAGVRGAGRTPPGLPNTGLLPETEHESPSDYRSRRRFRQPLTPTGSTIWTRPKHPFLRRARRDLTVIHSCDFLCRTSGGDASMAFVTRFTFRESGSESAQVTAGATGPAALARAPETAWGICHVRWNMSTFLLGSCGTEGRPDNRTRIPTSGRGTPGHLRTAGTDPRGRPSGPRPESRRRTPNPRSREARNRKRPCFPCVPFDGVVEPHGRGIPNPRRTPRGRRLPGRHRARRLESFCVPLESP